jgi:primosomal protein N'
MYVIQVTPLIRGTKLESLSYFSTVNYELGTFLQVPVRKKNQPAIVTSSKPVSESKTSLKSAAFSLRKLPVQKNPLVVPESIRKTATRLAEHYPASSGAIMYHLLPPDIRAGTFTHPHIITHQQQEDPTPQLLTARVDERFMCYQSHIRSTLARRGSILFVVPTTNDVAHAAHELSQGIKERVVTLSQTYSKKKREAALTQLLDFEQPKLIVTTAAYAYLERPDLQTIIIEQSASPHYVHRIRPYLDHRVALKAYAAVTGRSILLGDTLPTTEDEVQRRQDNFFTYGEEVKRIVFPAPLTYINQKDKPKPETESPFELFSPQLRKTVETTLEGRGRVFFYGARRGLAPLVSCIDCGFIFRCPDSNTPYSLLKSYKHGEESRWFVSSTSGKRIPAADTCEQCGSWRLRERGVGIQQVYDEWCALYPDHSVFLLDSETAPTARKAKKIIDDFYATKSAILIGTQVALPFLHRGVTVSAVISLDAARATPTWRADESLFRLLLRLRESTEREVLLQSRTPADSLIEHAKRGAVEKFYNDEIGLRQLLKYPPFVTFILLTWSGEPEVVRKAEEKLRSTLAEFAGEFYTNPHSTEKKMYQHVLFRVPIEHSEQYQKLNHVLRELPPFVKIEINPDRIL